ncbi:quinone oxidoreductase PIG3-like [Montipora capricornis]|uniref:quinone oxidoreductase PIG3-like n=1 Tax=Montipora capricornis TaxID=246305 RepID=UPI0035F1ADAF
MQRIIMNKGFVHLLFLCSVSLVLGNLTMKAVLYTPGDVSNLRIDTVDKPVAEKTKVLIRTHFTALNRADTLQRRGLYPPQPGESDILGLEVSGVIEDVGEDCVGKWKKGDGVMALLGGGGYAEYVAVDEGLVMHLPDSCKLSDSAAIPENWLTAYQLLHSLGKVQSGEVVLIHAGGSGVGTALIQLSCLAGARAFVTAGSEEKIKKAESLGARGGFNYKTGDFSSWVESVSEGQGANVILDCVGSSFWEQNIKSLAIDGRWIVYGLLGGGNVTGNLLGNVLRKRASIIGTTLKSRSLAYKKELVKGFIENVIPYFANGTLKTVVDSVIPMEEIQRAHKRMESNENIGKIIIQVIADEDTIKSEL